MKEAINSYANSLIEIWEKSLTSNYVLRCNAVFERLEKLESLHYKKVYNVADCMSSKHKSYTTHARTIQSISKKWKDTSIEFIIYSRKT